MSGFVRASWFHRSGQPSPLPPGKVRSGTWTNSLTGLLLVPAVLPADNWSVPRRMSNGHSGLRACWERRHFFQRRGAVYCLWPFRCSLYWQLELYRVEHLRCFSFVSRTEYPAKPDGVILHLPRSVSDVSVPGPASRSGAWVAVTFFLFGSRYRVRTATRGLALVGLAVVRFSSFTGSRFLIGFRGRRHAAFWVMRPVPCPSTLRPARPAGFPGPRPGVLPATFPWGQFRIPG